MSDISPTNLDKRAKRTREISIRVNDYELAERYLSPSPRPLRL